MFFTFANVIDLFRQGRQSDINQGPLRSIGQRIP